MKRDFRDSLDQLRWKHAANEYQRVCDFLIFAERIGYHADYWKNRKQTLENEYPSLRNGSPWHVG